MREGKEMKWNSENLAKKKSLGEVEIVENKVNCGFKLTMLLLLPLYAQIQSTKYIECHYRQSTKPGARESSDRNRVPALVALTCEGLLELTVLDTITLH